MQQKLGFMFIVVVLMMGTLLVAVATAGANTDATSHVPPSVPLIWHPNSTDGNALQDQAIGARQAITYATTITINTTTDPDKSSMTFTCAYSTGALYNIPADGLCSFRRALNEASNRPPADRPILIRFDLSTGDPNYNAGTDTWTVMVETDDNELAIDPSSVIEPDGSVTIDGDTQPGGRTTGPKIIIRSDASFHIRSDNNIIRNLAFQGDGNVIINETSNVGKNNTIENLWVGLNDAGDDIYYETNAGGTPIGLYGGLIRIESSDNNIIRNNIVAGSNNDAAISVLGSFNAIENNAVGLRADGTIPQYADKCNFANFFDPSNRWYGGGGVTVSGSFNQVMTNTIAGMFNAGTGAPARPPAVFVIGSENIISNNIIGQDKSGYDAGVCGLAIQVTGTTHDIINNLIVEGGVAETGSGFTEGSIYVNPGTPTFNQLTIQNNIVKGGQGLVVELGPTIASSNPLRTFMPARVTNINGTMVSGTNGIYVDTATQNETVNVCPNCTIDLYADDLDNLQEALEFLGTTTADANGDWTATLSRPLTENEGLRTQSTTQTSGTIQDYLAETSTVLSVLYRELTAPQEIEVSIPSPIYMNMAYTFTIAVTPSNTTFPITYTVESTDRPLSEGVLSSTMVTLRNQIWASAGTKHLTATAENIVGSASKTYTFEVLEDVQAELTVGSSGGSENFTTLDGLDTTLNVPAGAVSSDTTFTFTETGMATEDTSGFTVAGRTFTLVASQSLGGNQINVTLEYDPAQLGGVPEEELVLYYWNTSATPPAWADVLEACTGNVDYQRNPGNNTITAPICHLSDFFLGAVGSDEQFVYLPVVMK